jgi:hypothetical protein
MRRVAWHCPVLGSAVRRRCRQVRRCRLTAPSTIAAVLLSDLSKADSARFDYDRWLRRRHVDHGAHSRPRSVLLLLGRCDWVAGEQLGADRVGDVG